MRNNQPSYLPIPQSLEPLAELVAATRIPIDSDKMSDTLRQIFARRTQPAAQPEYTGGTLAIAARSHALVELSELRDVFRCLADSAVLPDGHILRTIDVPLDAFPALVAQSGDEQLAQAIDSGDPYTWLAQKIGVPRTVAKKGLFRLIAGQPDALLRRMLNTHDLDTDADLARVLAIREVFPDLFTYLNHLGDYMARPGDVAQALTNRVGNALLAEAHELLTSANVTLAGAAFAGPGTVTYVVAEDDSNTFTRTLAGLSLTREGITLNLDID